MLGAMADALAGVDVARIAALGITNQRETTLVWERKGGKPVGNAIVWQDRRTAPQCVKLKAAGHERLVRERTGLVLDPYCWNQAALDVDNVAGLRARAEAGALAFGTVDSFLILAAHRWQGPRHLFGARGIPAFEIVGLEDHRQPEQRPPDRGPPAGADHLAQHTPTRLAGRAAARARPPPQSWPRRSSARRNTRASSGRAAIVCRPPGAEVRAPTSPKRDGSPSQRG